MKLLALALLLGLPLTAVPAAEDDNMLKFGLYVVVSDLPRAQQFYEQLWNKPPYVRNDKLVGFDVAGGFFAAFQRAAGTGQPSANVVPYIRVADIDQEFARVKSLARLVDAQIVREPPLALFRFLDPDGNTIEFFAVDAPVK